MIQGITACHLQLRLASIYVYIYKYKYYILVNGNIIAQRRKWLAETQVAHKQLCEAASVDPHA